MHHLIPIVCLIILTFCLLAKRYSFEIGYLSLCGLPIAAFGLARVIGFRQFEHRLLHIAYDSSYILVMIGLALILQAVIRKRRVLFLLIATCFAGIPLTHILIMQP